MIDSFDEVFRFLADSGGYALIVGLQIILPFILVIVFLQWYMKDRSKRMDAREALERELSQAREAQIRLDFEERLQYERDTRDDYRSVITEYNNAVKMLNVSFGENGAIIRQAKEEIRRNAEALNRNTATLEKFLPTLPKKPTIRTPVETVERTVTQTVETKATGEVNLNG